MRQLAHLFHAKGYVQGKAGVKDRCANLRNGSTKGDASAILCGSVRSRSANLPIGSTRLGNIKLQICSLVRARVRSKGKVRSIQTKVGQSHAIPFGGIQCLKEKTVSMNRLRQ